MENKNSIQQIQILFGALFVGQFVFAGVAAFLKLNETPQVSPLVQYAPLLMMGLMVAGYFMFRKKIFEILNDQNLDADSKMSAYRAASMTKWAFFEAGNLLALVTFFVSADKQMLYLAIAGLVHFLIHFPTASRVAREVGL
ncbi:MAG: hypothetical protein RL757_1558 [Bacteroidota bacterium]|jgi:hypothetical protein